MSFDLREFGRQVQAFGLAIGVHGLMALLVVLGTMNWVPFKREEPVGLLIEAVMVDTSALQDQREEARQAAAREELREQREQELEQQREREQQRQQELDAQRQQELEQQRQREVEQQRKREAEDRLKQLQKERERKLEEERLQQQRELEKVRAEREAADRQRQQEAERLKQLENLRQQEEAQERLAAEAEAQRQAAAQREFQAGRLATERDKYILAIKGVVTQNWLRPQTAQAGLNCEVQVVQIPGGEVISASVTRNCNADPVTRRSIIAAVERVGSLPYRGFEEVFERELKFYFIYDGE